MDLCTDFSMDLESNFSAESPERSIPDCPEENSQSSAEITFPPNNPHHYSGNTIQYYSATNVQNCPRASMQNCPPNLQNYPGSMQQFQQNNIHMNPGNYTPIDPRANMQGGLSGKRSIQRQSFDIDFKIKLIKEAEFCSTRAIARKYHIDESVIRRWKRSRAVLEMAHLTGL